MKKYTQLVIWLIAGGVLGFFIGFLGEVPSLAAMLQNLTTRIDTIVYSLISLVTLLLIITFIYSRKIKSLLNQQTMGEDEDDKDSLIYKKFCDMSVYSTAALAISFFMLSVVFIYEGPFLFSYITFIATLIVNWYTYKIGRLVYPERKLPNYFENNIGEKLLKAVDEGERYVMFEGLYKAYHFINSGIIVSILIIVGYSIWSGNSQVFSIFIFCIIFLITNIIFLVTVRKKAY